MIRKFNFLAGVLLAMSAVVSCGSDDDNAKVVDTAQFIKDLNSAIDKLNEQKEFEEVEKLAGITIADKTKKEEAKKELKKAFKDAIEKVAKADNPGEEAKKAKEKVDEVEVKDSESIAVKKVLSEGYGKIAKDHEKDEKKK